MSSRDKKQTADYCVEHFAKLMEGIRKWDCDTVSYAEIHSAALSLSEDDEFNQILRRRWSEVKPCRTLPAETTHVDFAIEVSADLISEFFQALIDYMESYKGSICG